MGKFSNETVKVEIIKVTGGDVKELNEFLYNHRHRIIDIQTVAMAYDVCKFVIYLAG